MVAWTPRICFSSYGHPYHFNRRISIGTLYIRIVLNKKWEAAGFILTNKNNTTYVFLVLTQLPFNSLGGYRSFTALDFFLRRYMTQVSFFLSWCQDCAGIKDGDCATSLMRCGSYLNRSLWDKRSCIMSKRSIVWLIQVAKRSRDSIILYRSGIPYVFLGICRVSKRKHHH